MLRASLSGSKTGTFGHQCSLNSLFSVSLLGEAGGEGGGEAGSRGQSRLAGLAGQLRSPPPHSITMIPILILNRGGVSVGGTVGRLPLKSEKLLFQMESNNNSLANV